MFDVGFSELLIIAVVALVVLGPQRLPHAARLAGLWVRRLRAQWWSVKADLERELAEEEFRRSVGEPLADLRKRLADEAKAMRADLEAQMKTPRADAPPPAADTAPVPATRDDAADPPA
jgi:sec-independent protein translocase protein TatB